MSEVVDASLFGGGAAILAFPHPAASTQRVVTFHRGELRAIFQVYGHMVASGEWRDYAIDMLRERAVFSVFRRSSEVPLFTIEKVPKNARRQGAYAVVAQGGRIVKRGHELEKVLRVFAPKPSLVG